MRAVESYLAERSHLALRSTVVRMHANILGEAAQQGRPGELVLQRLLERAREQLGVDAAVEQLLAQATRGIVFVDEIDKIRAYVGGRPNTSGIRAQEALLMLVPQRCIQHP